MIIFLLYGSWSIITYDSATYQLIYDQKFIILGLLFGMPIAIYFSLKSYLQFIVDEQQQYYLKKISIMRKVPIEDLKVDSKGQVIPNEQHYLDQYKNGKLYAPSQCGEK